MASKKGRILCVEDNEDACDILGHVLADYEVVPAMTFAEGLRLAKSEHFDLYLLDRTYPDGDGLELCRQLRAFDKQTPILFHSASGRESEIRDAITAGAQEYLVKPIGITELEDSVERLIGSLATPALLKHGYAS
ncbi:MAG: response regulator [Blastocatellia bacterium]